jgi:transposase InsO family protein
MSVNVSNGVSVEKLDGTNYHVWKFKMQLILEDKDLFGVIDGTDVKPEKADAVAEWVKRDKKARVTICLALSDSVLATVRSCETAVSVWEKLASVFESKSLVNRLFMRRKLLTMKMSEGDALSTHINMLKTLAEQLAAIGAQTSEEDLVMTLLMSLPPSYEHFITALESVNESELTYDYVVAKLLNFDLRKKENGAPSGESALVMQHKSDPSKFICFYCKESGHFKKDCPKLKIKRFERANNVKDESSEMVFIAGDGADQQCWYIDSGATQHMSGDRAAFVEYENIAPKAVYMGDNNKQDAVGQGSVKMVLDVAGNALKAKFTNVLFVPNLKSNLISVSRLIKDGFSVQFGVGGCAIYKNGVVVAQGVSENRLYRLNGRIVYYEKACVAHASASTDAELWHRRLGHLSESGMKSLISSAAVHGLELSSSLTLAQCEGCLYGKHIRQPFPSASEHRATVPLELIHTDLCGPMKFASLGGSRYFVSFIDDYSRRISVFPINRKSEVIEKFRLYRAASEKQLGLSIKTVRSDNGGEYIGEFRRELLRHGIGIETSAPYTPEQNGVAERMNRTLVESARSMIHAQGLGQEFWGEAIVTAAYIRNRVVSRSTQGKSPEELWSGKKPTVRHLRVWGCVAFAQVPAEKRSKFDAKSIRCIMVGYSETSKAWRLWDLERKCLVISRDVVFNESRTMPQPVESVPVDAVVVPEQPVPPQPVPAPVPTEVVPAVVAEPVGDAPADLAPPVGEVEVAVRRSARQHRQPGEWWKVSEHANLASSEPQTYEQAVNSPEREHWLEAIKSEHKSLVDNQTWELVEKPKDRKLVSCKWVFKVKHNADGSVERYKARLVARGFTQTEGVDYHETYAPVVKMTSIRVLLSIVAIHDLELHQMDVKTAFLNGVLEEEIYMQQPEGFVEPGKEHLVCKLKRTLYGLKQSPRVWYQTIDKFFANMGLKRVEGDYGLYVIWSEEVKCIIALYVDDLLLACNSVAYMDKVKQALHSEYDMKDLGEAKFVLGIEIERDRSRREIYLNQQHYIENVLERYRMSDCKPVSTPMESNFKLTKSSAEVNEREKQEMETVPYQSAVGSLMYAMTCTRPDIAFAVSTVSRFCSNYNSSHWAAVKRIMRYLKGTAGYRLKLGGGTEVLLSGYCDADWAGDLDERKSTTGYAFYIGDGVVSWNSKRQQTVALSTAEAEYMAATQATKESLWLKQLLGELGLVQSQPVLIRSDNQGCIALTKNPAYHSRTKHIDIRHHFIRDSVEVGDIELRYVATDDMAADVLTKALARDKHEKHTAALGLSFPKDSQSGSVESK